MLLSNLEKEIVKIKKKQHLPTPRLSLLWPCGCEYFNLTVFYEDTHCWIAIGFSGILTNVLRLELKKTWCGWCLLITNSPFSRVWEKTIFLKKFQNRTIAKSIPGSSKKQKLNCHMQVIFYRAFTLYLQLFI